MLGRGQSPAIHREGPPKVLVRLPNAKLKKCTVSLRSRGKYNTSPPHLPEADVDEDLVKDIICFLHQLCYLLSEA